MSPPAADTDRRGVVEIRLRNIAQLFNPMDPSPLGERDLDASAEEFIVSWVRELPRDAPLQLVVHLRDWPGDSDPEAALGRALGNYFHERARITHSNLQEELRRGRINLLIGALFIGACLLMADLLGAPEQRGFVGNFVYDGLTIIGWVVLWRPLEIFLFDYWALRRREHLLRRIAEAPVSVRQAINPEGAGSAATSIG